MAKAKKVTLADMRTHKITQEEITESEIYHMLASSYCGSESGHKILSANIFLGKVPRVHYEVSMSNLQRGIQCGYRGNSLTEAIKAYNGIENEE